MVDEEKVDARDPTLKILASSLKFIIRSNPIWRSWLAVNLVNERFRKLVVVWKTKEGPK